MTTAHDIARLTNRELRALLREGHPIDPAALDDSAYRGVSLGLPRLLERLSWKTFRKVFHRDPARGTLRGWNVRVEQRGVDAPSRARMRRGEEWTFGHYVVCNPLPDRAPQGVAHALLLDYGAGRNARLDPISRVRDPLVAINAGSVELLLGYTYLDLGMLVDTPSFFTLEREGRLEKFVAPPR